MASGFVCDRCGAAIFPKENSTFALGLHGPEGSIGTMGPAGDYEYGPIDLCPKCASAVSDIITRRIVTSQTNMDAWVIADEPKKKVKTDAVGSITKTD